MPKFIKLTEQYTNGKTETVMLNTAFILSVKKSKSGEDTHINMQDKHYFFVKETVAEVEAMLLPFPIAVTPLNFDGPMSKD